MTTHISVSIDTIASLASSLGTLHSDFVGVPETATDLSSTLGAREVRDALDEFSNNWKTRRGRLLESIDAVKTMSSEAGTSFAKVDLELANEILGT